MHQIHPSHTPYFTRPDKLCNVWGIIHQHKGWALCTHSMMLWEGCTSKQLSAALGQALGGIGEQTVFQQCWDDVLSRRGGPRGSKSQV
eukprot:1161060-Pelagomonas_calceolata.AAC.13